MIDKEINEIRENFLKVKNVVIMNHKKLFHFIISIIKTTLNYNKDIKNTILFRNNIVNMVFDTGYSRVYKYCKRDPYNSKIKTLINLCNRNIEKALNGIDLLLCTYSMNGYLLFTNRTYTTEGHLYYYSHNFGNMLQEIKGIIYRVLIEDIKSDIPEFYTVIDSFLSSMLKYMNIFISFAERSKYLNYSVSYILFLIVCVYPDIATKRSLDIIK